jgi:hypothetical protein
MEWRSDGVLPPANPDGFPVNDSLWSFFV